MYPLQTSEFFLRRRQFPEILSHLRIATLLFYHFADHIPSSKRTNPQLLMRYHCLFSPPPLEAIQMGHDTTPRFFALLSVKVEHSGDSALA